MIYKRKRSKVKILLAIVILVIIVLFIFRFDLKNHVFGDRLKVLSSKESLFFVKNKTNLEDSVAKLAVLDENKGIMIFTIENSDVNLEDITKKFSGEELIGRIRRDADTFDGYSSDQKVKVNLLKDTKVEILSHYDSEWYYIKPIDGGEAVWINEEMLRMPYTPKTKLDVLTDEEVEVYINSVLVVKSKTSRMIYVDIMRQTLYVFDNYSDKWDLVKRLKCMTGTSRNPILKGEFEIIKKDDKVVVESEKINYKYLSKMSNDFDIRSNPVSISPLTSENTSSDAKEEINRSFKGNIWLSEDDAKWIYENIDINTSVIIK